MNILVVDIGGSHIKLMLKSYEERRKFDSGPEFTPRQFIAETRKQTADWSYDAVSIGFPAPIVQGKPVADPQNLGPGWTKFDFYKAFPKPVKLINDAALQAIGSYAGGRMLFLGLGTGLGSAMILDGVVVPLELGQLRYSEDETVEDRVSKRALKKRGPEKWETAVHEAVAMLRRAFVTDYIVLGGGNARRLAKLPAGAKLGGNENAFVGGVRLWDQADVSAEPRKHTLVIA